MEQQMSTSWTNERAGGRVEYNDDDNPYSLRRLGDNIQRALQEL